MNQLKIHVENDTVILRGNSQESVGAVLRGNVILTLKETIKVKSIILNLNGKLKIQLNEKTNHKEFIMMDKNVNCLPVNQKKKLHVLTPDTYKYPFEFVLPGSLIETIDSNTYGSLLYKLKVTVDRPPFVPNLIERKSIRVIRELDQVPSYDLMLPIELKNEWLNKLEYNINLPKKLYTRGEKINININLIPKLLSSAQLNVRYISCFLKEYTTFVLNNNHLKQSRIIKFVRDKSLPSLSTLDWNKSIELQLPNSFDLIQSDVKNQFFKVEHKLKFTISFINNYGELSELKATIPIEILNYQQQSFNELPSYENSWRSLLINNSHPIFDQDNIITPPSYEHNHYTIQNHHEYNDYFNYQPPPSCNFNSNDLPTYNSIFFTPPSYEL